MSVTTLRPIGRRIHVRAELLARIDAVLTDESADHGDIDIALEAFGVF